MSTSGSPPDDLESPRDRRTGDDGTPPARPPAGGPPGDGTDTPAWQAEISGGSGIVVPPPTFSGEFTADPLPPAQPPVQPPATLPPAITPPGDGGRPPARRTPLPPPPSYPEATPRATLPPVYGAPPDRPQPPPPSYGSSPAVRPALPPARPALPPARPALPPARPALPAARPALPPARPALPPARSASSAGTAAGTPPPRREIARRSPPPAWEQVEDWLRPPGKERRRIRPRRGAISVIATLLVAAGGAAGTYRWMSREEPAPKAEPAVRVADAVFSPAPGATTDGRVQGISGISSSGRVVVAAGSEIGTVQPRPRFLVSADAGRTWKVGKVVSEAAGGAVDATPDKIVGSSNGWLAMSRAGAQVTAWTSQNGRTWVRLKDAVDAFPAGDQVRRLAHDAQTYAAVGADGKGRAVLWLSADARRWQRVSGDALKLPVSGKETVRRLDYVAAEDSTLLLAGEVSRGKSTRAGAWRSNDAGRTWKTAAMPSANGAAGRLHLAADSSEFFALREGKDGDKRVGVVFNSQDGQSWQVRGEIPLTPGQALEFADFSSGTQELGALAVGKDSRTVLYHGGDGGLSWRQTGTLPADPARAVHGMAVAGGSVTVAGDMSQKSGQDFYLAVAGGSGAPRVVDLARVPDAINTERSVQDLAVAGGRVVAVGSTNADIAAWNTTDGKNWQRADTSRLSGDGAQTLSGVAPGPRGWLAIGDDQGKPLVAASGDGNSWQRVDGIKDPAFAEDAEDAAVTLTGTAGGPKGYVLAGNTGPSPVVWTSSDLQKWKRADGKGLAAAKGSANAIAHVTATATGYVAVGETKGPAADGAAPTSRPAVWTSADGVTWKAGRAPLPQGATAARLTHVAVRGATVVASGVATVAGDRPYVLVSEDSGATWRATPLPMPAPGLQGSASTVAATGTGLAVAGNAGAPADGDVLLWTSADGRSWQVVAPKDAGLSGPGLQRIRGLAGIGGDLLGVGLTTDAHAEHLTLWRRPAGRS